MEPAIKFLIPNPNKIVSGGNIFNRHLIDGWKKNGGRAAIIDKLPSFSPINRSSEKEILVVDTLFLDHFSECIEPKNVDYISLLLVHHLESLYPPDTYSSKTYFEKKEKPKLQSFDAFLTTSEYTKSYLLENGITKPILVVPPALSFIPAPISKTAPSQLQALIVANLVERKGILPFLQKLNEKLSEPHADNLNIDILGTDKIETDYANRCLVFIAENPLLEKVVNYRGEHSQDKIFEFYKKANLFISSSFMETFGMAIQEAVAFQLPILALNHGNIPFHVAVDQNGYVFDDMESLIKMLLKLSLDKEAFNSLAEKSSRFRPYENYTWKEAALSLKSQLLELQK